MTLTLEIITTPTGMPGARERTFREDGGRIGRLKSNDWVLPHNKVSGCHAVITYRNGVFYIEDRSRNGVFLNSTTNRLTPCRPQALQSGDCLFIEPYEIQVSIAEDADHRALGSDGDDDPFAQRAALPEPDGVEVDQDQGAGYEVDPLKLIAGNASPRSEPKPARGREIISAEQIEGRDPMAGSYQPPAIAFQPPTPTPPPGPMVIPPDYDPMAPDTPVIVRRSVPAAELNPFDVPNVPEAAVAAPANIPPSPEPVSVPAMPEGPSAGVVVPRVQEARRDENVDARDRSTSDLASVLAGAGLGSLDVTPELAESFGRILRVVVSGIMDLLRARQQVKDELRMRQTQFRPADNNPLKFSANVDDALHNLLVKRNPAYLKPVEAFGDAFDDLRDHQLAMLAGIRVAFEAMLAEFAPDRLEEQFDRQIKRGALLSVPAKLRYWDSYRDHSRQLLQDVDATFRRWFGEEFVKAYEEQLERLDSERRAKTP